MYNSDLIFIKFTIIAMQYKLVERYHENNDLGVMYVCIVQ